MKEMGAQNNMNLENNAPLLGILVRPKVCAGLPFAPQRYYQSLTAAGSRLGVRVFVFALSWIHWRRRTVTGYAYDEASGEWKKGEFPLSGAIYDRAFYRTAAELRRHRILLRRLLQRSGVKLLGWGLGGKFEIYSMLSGDPVLKQRLPRTERYSGPGSLQAWLGLYGEAIVKPEGGTHGKGVLHIRRSGADRYIVRGRDGSNRPVAKISSGGKPMLEWIHSSMATRRPFLIQQYIPSATRSGEPFDIRALVQKDGQGKWRLTGAAARVGEAGGVTSNLHGGGTPREAADLLRQEYGAEQAEDVLRQIRDIALRVPLLLERTHGPLLELGIDFGVDRQGSIWLLEVNSKPGRTSFARLNDKRARIAAVTRPIRYARYVLDRQLGGQINEFDVKQGAFYKKFG